MKKKVRRVMAAVVSVILAAAPLSASAELLVPKISQDNLYSTVVAVNEGGNCLIMDDYHNWVITQEEFHQYAGVDFDLKPGDVIFCYDAASVYPNSYASGYYYRDWNEDPLQVYFVDTATIQYLGTAQEFYGDQVKELTVTDTTQKLMALSDEEGNIYYTKDSYSWGWAESGESYGIPSGGYHVGDKVLCAVVPAYNDYNMSAVILEKTYEAEEPDYTMLSPIVTAVSEDRADCLLSDGTTVTQAEFRQYSGEAFDLQKGDVISVNDAEITYLGKAEEIYAEYVTELTVTDMDKNGEPVWRDAEGNFYNAEVSYSDSWTKSGIPNNGFRMRDFWVGEKVLCVPGVSGNHTGFGCDAVILEKTEDVDKSQGDTSIVIAISNGTCLLSNDVAIGQDLFQKYSGEAFDLKVGDVITLQRTDRSPIFVLETYPGQYPFDKYSRFVYQGHAKDYYAEKVKEMTVCDFETVTEYFSKNEYQIPVFQDAEGNIYEARYSSYLLEDGYEYGIMSDECEIGDTALCYLSSGDVVIPLEKTTEAENQEEWDGEICVVEAITEDGGCLLSMGCTISQNTFRHYSGEDFDLQIGDVIRVRYTEIKPIIPGQFVYDDNFDITYVGKTNDYYADDVTELTVSGIEVVQSLEGNQYRLPVFEDAEGETYSSSRFYSTELMDQGYQYALMPGEFGIGDTVLALTNSRKAGTILLERISEAERTPGDTTGDGVVDLLDVISINKNLMTGWKLAPAGIRAADFNGDGKLDASESLLLLKYLVKVTDTLEFD